MTKVKTINPQPIFELLQERERILNVGTTEELIELAKTYGTKPIENSTTLYKSTVARLRQRLTDIGLDPEVYNEQT